MSDPNDVEYCPSRADPWSQVAFQDFNQVAVAQYGPVQYFQPSDSEAEGEDDVINEGRLSRANVMKNM
jgi:hypothetical protein